MFNHVVSTKVYTLIIGNSLHVYIGCIKVKRNSNPKDFRTLIHYFVFFIYNKAET